MRHHHTAPERAHRHVNVHWIATLVILAAVTAARTVRAQQRPTFELRMTGGPTRAFGSWGVGLDLSGALILGSHLLQARNSLGIDVSYASTGTIYGSSSRSVISIVASWRSEFIPPHGGVRSYLQAGVGVVGSNVTVPNLPLSGSYGGQPAPVNDAWGPTATAGVGAIFSVAPQIDVQVGGEVALQNIYAGYYSPIVRGLVGFVFRE